MPILGDDAHAPRQAPCAPWTTEALVAAYRGCSGKTFDAGIVQTAIDVASRILFELSGRQFPGECTTTFRPCRRRGGDASPSWWEFDSSWGWCGCASDPCSCAGVDRIQLGVQPLNEVDEVLVDGVALVAGTDYRIDDNLWLVRLGGQAWPASQDLSKDPLADVDTFQVIVRHGMPVPPDGELAARALACNLALAMSPAGTGDCQLPQRVVSYTRQGVSVALIDPWTFLDRGRTGIYEVDLFLSAVNPGGLRRRGAVGSPDFMGGATRAGT